MYRFKVIKAAPEGMHSELIGKIGVLCNIWDFDENLNNKEPCRGKVAYWLAFDHPVTELECNFPERSWFFDGEIERVE